ncbi:kanadaptin [Plodia interpunctella]|uniref:kanadaptin n=1 Tax=Plodia interpunctella TaxID=58824 RepID=UPI002367ED93|nr:kanadaptin [Plodia interpunctella]
MEDIKSTSEDCQNEPKIEFKKPVLIGRIGKLPKKAKNDSEKPPEPKAEEKSSESVGDSSSKSNLPPAVLLKELSTPIPYKEPKWSGLCPDGSEYGLEVLKSGMIVEKVDLTSKPYYVFGRLANCDVVMAHPTISRHHAVLQYKAFAAEGEAAAGWYVRDLASTHGTFLNRERLASARYVRVRVGHQLRFGNSTRTYIMLGPDFDCEGESELSVSEIKQRAQNMKAERERMIKEATEQREKDRLAEEKRREEQGIDWGMGEDAEEEPDLADNPYAVTANEELYLDDPKKTLRGYYEREGHELVYDCEERGPGQFMCRVELPIDDARGRAVMAEVMHRGKKKEAVIACALEACRILDRAGLLRQAKHESRRRKERDWSADDYYDSDDDTFLDRTGAVEKKRSIRMKKHNQQPDKPLTYDDLLKQISDIETKITAEEKCLARLRENSKPVQQSGDEDALDAFMSSLSGKQSVAQKADISNAKMNIRKLQAELSKVQRLAEIARPAHLPPLIKKEERTGNKMAVKIGSNSVVYGKRIKLKEDMERRPKVRIEVKKEEAEFVEEVDSDEGESEGSRTEGESEKSTGDKKGPSETASESSKSEEEAPKKVYGPMRPPEDYVIPENYFDQETERDLPEIMEKE